MNNLHLSEEVQADLTEIEEYISKELENPAVALSIVRKITKGLRILFGDLPEETIEYSAIRISHA